MVLSKTITSLKCITQIEGAFPSKNFSIATDSRTYKSGELFVALEGGNFNGALFLESVWKQGCAVGVCRDCASNRELVANKIGEKITMIWVQDTLVFLHELAAKHIRDWQKSRNISRNIIGITGSNGKTTCKEMLFHFLDGLYPGKIFSTYKNFNNQIGLPLTILQLENCHEHIILEMGTNVPGEIKILSEIANPNMGLITNIGDAHLETFQNRDGVFAEKRALYDFINSNPLSEKNFLINGSDKYLQKLEDHSWTSRIGAKGKYQIKVFDSYVDVVLEGKKYTLRNSMLLGDHNFSNLGICFILSAMMFPGSVESLVKIANGFIPKDGRSTWINFEGAEIFFDAYNANPSSMRSAVDGFVGFCMKKGVALDRCLFVLGDMNELGDQSAGFHRDMGQHLAQVGVQNAAFIGVHSSAYNLGFANAGTLFKEAKEYKNGAWRDALDRFDYIFIKGSRSLQLELLIE